MKTSKCDRTRRRVAPVSAARTVKPGPKRQPAKAVGWQPTWNLLQTPSAMLDKYLADFDREQGGAQ